MTDDKKILEVEDLRVAFSERGKAKNVVHGISFSVDLGQTLAIVGESGSGKSVTALSIMRLLPSHTASIPSGRISFAGTDLLKLSDSKIRQYRGNKIAMIFQEPMTSLNPLIRIGKQVAEPMVLHQGITWDEGLKKAVSLLGQVGIPDAEKRIYQYPHEFSGGQLQRIMIAMAISCEPALLIADEPTTALDVTIQKQVLEVLKEIQERKNMAMLFITHDLGIVADVADHVAVMNQGKIVEHAATREIFSDPKDPYTRGLLACRPTLKTNSTRLFTVSDFAEGKKLELKAPDHGHKITQGIVLEVKDLNKVFFGRKGFLTNPTNDVHAVKNCTFKVHKGETFGLVGESGCGKTTLGRTIIQLEKATSGSVLFNNEDMTLLPARELRAKRRKIQYIFQDPYGSLNPRLTVGSALTEPMQVHKIGASKRERMDRAAHLLEQVGLSSDHLKRYPHQFSGGQRQRICIARALALEPEFIICDESVSALDVSVQAQILNLLLDLQDQFELSYIFISHDLSVVRFMSDRIAVMLEGEIVELASAKEIYTNPQHPFTKKLLDAIPTGVPKGLNEADVFTVDKAANS